MFNTIQVTVIIINILYCETCFFCLPVIYRYSWWKSLQALTITLSLALNIVCWALSLFEKFCSDLPTSCLTGKCNPHGQQMYSEENDNSFQLDKLPLLRKFCKINFVPLCFELHPIKGNKSYTVISWACCSKAFYCAHRVLGIFKCDVIDNTSESNVIFQTRFVTCIWCCANFLRRFYRARTKEVKMERLSVSLTTRLCDW